MTKRRVLIVIIVVVMGLSGLAVRAADAPDKPALMSEVYPGLASNCLTYAKLSELPAGVVLRTDSLTIKDTDIAAEMAKVPQEMQTQIKKNALFLLENLAARQLLVAQANAKATERKEPPASDERTLIQNYLKSLVADVQVSEAEVSKFYEENKESCGGASLDQMKDSIRQLVLQQKQQDFINEHVRTMGQRVPIEVSASWTKEQAVLARDNPVDKARSSGKPSLVDFGSTGCRPCDMLAPILETLKEKYAGKVNVLFVHVGQEQILAARYGIQTIPMQFFYDKDGKEVFRHTGFWAQAEIEKKLAEMGVE